MSRAQAAMLIGLTLLPISLRADEFSSPVTTCGEVDEIKVRALIIAEAARKRFEESGDTPVVTPAFDPSREHAPAVPISRALQPAQPSTDPAAELQRIEAQIRHRAVTGEDKQPNCYYGPICRRISVDRLRQIAKDYGETDAAWHALLASPEDPNLPPVPIVVGSPNGPTCHPDVNKELLERREELLRQRDANR